MIFLESSFSRPSGGPHGCSRTGHSEAQRGCPCPPTEHPRADHHQPPEPPPRWLKVTASSVTTRGAPGRGGPLPAESAGAGSTGAGGPPAWGGWGDGTPGRCDEGSPDGSVRPQDRNLMSVTLTRSTCTLGKRVNRPVEPELASDATRRGR